MARNFNSLFESIKRRFSKDAFDDFVDYSENALNEIKNDIINDVRVHKISQELYNHTIPSAFLSSSSSSLFGFMGFTVGTSPVDNLINVLNDLIVISTPRNTLFNRIAGKKVALKIPTWRELRDSNEITMEWDSISWPEAVERGISGLSHYIQRANAGRSKEGFQAKGQIRDAEYTKTPFLSEIFSKARQKIKKFVK